MTTIGNNIRRIALEQGIPLNEIARRGGVSKRTAARIARTTFFR